MASRVFGKKEVVFKKGDKGDQMFQVRQGLLGVYAAYGTPEETLLTKLGPGDIVGEMAILNEETRSATVVALDYDTELDVLTREDFLDRCAKEPEFALQVMNHMGSRIRQLTEDYMKAANTVTQVADHAAKAAPLSKDVQESVDFYRNALRLFHF